MRKSIALFIVLISVQLFAQEKSLVTVKDTVTTSGVIVVTIQENGKSVDIQCTQSFPNCTAPAAGEYWMVRLPKNHGLYDCANVDLYPKSTQASSTDQVVGEYCLNTK